MKDNLEDIEFSAVINPEGKNYAILRKELTPAYKKVRWDIIKGYIFLALIFSINIFLLRWGVFKAIIAVPVSSFLVGYCLAYLHLFVHAAVHYDLHQKKSVNDLISDYFLGVF